jgi:3-deoxy-D-manno-octulosonate 8-phosphate phosphatase (KDO 8-P phosphatase)
MNILSHFKSIKAFAFDVDGVLTDGTLFLMPGGEMVRRMNIKDGYALQLAVKKGYHVIIISGGKSDMVQDRLQKLGISNIFMQVHDKQAVLNQYMQQHNLSKEQVLYMGDDMPDLEVMAICGLPCCPADACIEIKELSLYVSNQKGGESAARDVIEKVLKLNNDWQHTNTIQSR